MALELNAHKHDETSFFEYDKASFVAIYSIGKGIYSLLVKSV